MGTRVTIDKEDMRRGNVGAIREYLSEQLEHTKERLTLEIKVDVIKQLQGKSQAYKELYDIFK